MTRFQIIAFIFGAGFFFVIVQLIRRRHLKEKYSLIWFLAGVLLIVFALWRNLVEFLADLFGIDYAPAVLLLLLVFLGVGFFLSFSVIVSKLSDRSRRLAQEVALLRHELDSIRKGEPRESEGDETAAEGDETAHDPA